MYRPSAYVVDDITVLHAAVRRRRFATIAAVADGAIAFAYAPVALDSEWPPNGRLRFHLARANPLAEAGRWKAKLSFLGPDTYISPDWYQTHALVPTWNYIAVEADGVAEELSESDLRLLLADLSAAEERELIPKQPWTLGKIPEARIDALLKGIRGFAVPIEMLKGKFKLSQDKNAADFAGAVAGLEARGDAASLAVAHEMRRLREP